MPTMKQSTTVWIFLLIFVNMHHNQLQNTSAAVVKKQEHFMQLHRTAAASRSKYQHQQSQKWFPRYITKEVVGDVVSVPGDVEKRKENDGIKYVEEERTATITTGPTRTTSAKLFMQQLLKQLGNKHPKLKATTSGAEVSTSEEAFEIVSAEMKGFPNTQTKEQFKSQTKGKVHESLIYNFKENLQNLLKSDSSQRELQLEATSSTKKREAIMPQPPSTTITSAASSSTSVHVIATSPATVSMHTTTNKEYEQFDAHSTAVERRHVKPEKLKYTKEIIIKQGSLMGIQRHFPPSSGLRAVDQYLGIPYAEAPVGSRRFMPPGAALPWQGLKMAHHLPPVCPQNLPDISLHGTAKMSKGRYKHLTRLLPYLKTESEDCLYLNIYVPNDSNATADVDEAVFAYASAAAAADEKIVDESFMKKHLYPVVVYIHGESFEWNSGNAYDGSVLASYGEVIVVTINYRLGIFGFMRPSINENTVANFGLLDQIAALHWIKENIHSFGGDKNSVTLMGHTTGAACINYLMVSPVASGLFHRAILMSGSAMSDWAATNHSLQLTMQIAHGLNCPLNDDNEEMLSCLRQKRYQDILKIPTTLAQFSTSLGPIVDGHVIPSQPYKVMGQYTEHFGRYDLLFGITESESYHSLAALTLEEGLREDERDNLLRFYMQSRFDVRPDLALAATLKKYSDMYNNPIKATNIEHRDIVLDILSDARVVGPLMQTGLFHADVNRHTYMYVFGHNSFGGPHASLPHSIAGEELAFVFGAPFTSAGLFHRTQYTAQERLLSEAVMSYWCNFVKTGNPKAPWKGNFINLHALEWDRYDLEWPEFNKRSQAYMNIGIPPSVGYKYRQVYMNFWNKELPDELNQIALIQLQPFLQANSYNINNKNYDSVYASRKAEEGGTIVNDPKLYGSNLDAITVHMSKFDTVDKADEDPIRRLKLLLQEPYGGVKDTKTENMYNAPPSTQYKGNVMPTVRKGVAVAESEEDGHVEPQGFQIRYNGYTSTRSPFASIYGPGKFETQLSGGIEDKRTPNVGYGVNYIHRESSANADNEMNENSKPLRDATNSNKNIAKSETTLHLLIVLIIIFIILNLIIYSTFLMQKKRKTKTMQRKLGDRIFTYNGNTDDDLKRFKTSIPQNCDDGDESFIMSAVRKSNTYEQVKLDRSPLNGCEITMPLSSSTTHAKVSEWITTISDPPKQAPLQRRASSSSNSKTSSSFSSSLRGSGSFGKPQPCKISVAIDATPNGRGSSVLEQEPIEITKLKQSGRNLIICQDVEVEDQEWLTPQDSIDNSRYSLMRQHSAATEACEIELIQPKHQHSRSDPIDMYYDHNEKVTSFISNDHHDYPDINVTSKDNDYEVPAEALTAEQQLSIIKKRRYPKVLPTFLHHERETDSPPMTRDLRCTNKRNSLPPNAYFPNFAHSRQAPPLPPPISVATLGRKPSLTHRNSNMITTSRLMLAHDYAEEEDEEPEITQNTLIVGSLKPTEAYLSTLRRNNKQANLNTQGNVYMASQTEISSPLRNQQQSVFQSFESHAPNYKTPDRDVAAHLTERIYNIQSPIRNDRHQPTCCNSLPTTPLYDKPATPIAIVSDLYAQHLPGVIYAQPKKSHLQRLLSNVAAPTPANTSQVHSNASDKHANKCSPAVANNCKDLSNSNQVVPLLLDTNQVPLTETLQLTGTNDAATATMPQARAQHLNKTLSARQEEQPNITLEENDANLKPRATITTPDTSALANANQLALSHMRTTETTELHSTIVLSTTQSEKPPATTQPPTSLVESTERATLRTPPLVTSSAFGTNEISNVPTKPSSKSSSSSLSTSSTASASSSSSSSSQSSDTSSSTGTVRTELQQK